MKMKVLAVLLGFSCCFTGASHAAADYTMIVAPARYSVLQVLFDVIGKRSAVLVAYQRDDAGEPFMHAWNDAGAYWSPIDLHDLGELSFVQKTPSKVVLIGDNTLLPSRIKDAVSWMPDVEQVRQLENAALLNEFGRIMKWSDREWSWFAGRYNLKLEDEAAPTRNRSWYDQSGPLIRQDQPVYDPVPVVDQGDTINPSSTSLPDPEPIDEVPSVDHAPIDSDAAAADTPDEIQEIVETLEQATQDDGETAP